MLAYTLCFHSLAVINLLSYDVIHDVFVLFTSAYAKAEVVRFNTLGLRLWSQTKVLRV